VIYSFRREREGVFLMLFVTSLLLVYIHLFLDDDDDDGVFLKVSIVLPYSSRLISPSFSLSVVPPFYTSNHIHVKKKKYTDNTSRPIYP